MAEQYAPLRIGITGARGMLGWQAYCRLSALSHVDVRTADRSTFASADALAAFCADLDAVLHFACRIRGTSDEIASENEQITGQLIAGLERAGSQAHVILASSTQEATDTPYGAAKRRAGEQLAAWAERGGGALTTMVLPNVFGEGGRPFHNSVVHTFCHQLAQGKEPEVNRTGEISLIDAGTVVETILQQVRRGERSRMELPGRALTVGELYDKLHSFAQLYRDQAIIPDVRDDLDLCLFNTLRYFLFPQAYPINPPLRTDERGTLFEAVKELNGGQCFLSTTEPGVTRGDHYHFDKIERFLVIDGEAIIRIRRVGDDDVTTFHVSGSRPQFVDMPTLHTHHIVNVGGRPLTTMFWSHELFDPNRPDTYACPV
ncbi:polysaccharide biosynthesis C-terminal domain-containing protein [Rhodovibrio salinarum]|uniref:UDP-2-acetamido-2,6-beta-L-arabino-hexul-4-ose reductase n=1 Tax=Rhodovibrio salinarum TaxID=1087 RepID=A0A934QHJ1_9PROT|nr:NAD-dependent epimerase/dehydratase family protein [Rhodovibrio salinarum]MBK1696665.1 hypothetical protein [Rhodovibrio salinarum]